jgi:hypothetical protein
MISNHNWRENNLWWQEQNCYLLIERLSKPVIMNALAEMKACRRTSLFGNEYQLESRMFMERLGH